MKRPLMSWLIYRYAKHRYQILIRLRTWKYKHYSPLADPEGVGVMGVTTPFKFQKFGENVMKRGKKGKKKREKQLYQLNII